MGMDFKENLKVPLNEQDEQKIRKIDAYRIFISEAMPGYISFMEAINHTITELEAEGVIGKTSLKTRVKALNSALFNTEQKELDDIFGFDIVAQNERDKEILMLIIHNLFVSKYLIQKNHNKSNGYFAHHCTGAVKKNLDGTEALGLEKHILDSETYELKEQYRDYSRKEQKNVPRKDLFCKKHRYPVLRQEILENGKIDSKLQENFEWALDFIDQYLGENPVSRKNIPIIEIQFKTAAVEKEIKYGKAQHVKYKKVNEDEVKRKYLQRQLVRGIDFPFIFIRNNEGELQLQHSTQTLTNMWPFLEDTITEYKQTHSCPVANYDMYFGKIFPDLEPYVQRNLANEPSIPTDNLTMEGAWSILKNKIINNSFYLPDSDKVLKVELERK